MYLIKYILAFIAFALKGMIMTSLLMQKTNTGFEGGPQLLLNGLLFGLAGLLLTHLLVNKVGMNAKILNSIYLIVIFIAVSTLYSGVLQKN
jgi:hypothetical protein